VAQGFYSPQVGFQDLDVEGLLAADDGFGTVGLVDAGVERLLGLGQLPIQRRGETERHRQGKRRWAQPTLLGFPDV
jgi:hypothetical protein